MSTVMRLKASLGYSADQLTSLERSLVVDNLVNSGQWVASANATLCQGASARNHPASIFVTAMDTNPLAADPALIIAQRGDDFANGLKAVNPSDRWSGASVYGRWSSSNRCYGSRVLRVTNLLARTRQVWPEPMFILSIQSAPRKQFGRSAIRR